MQSKSPAFAAPIVVLMSAIFFAGCHKQVARSTPPQAAPVPQPPRPTVTLSASPDHITTGGNVTLKWSSAYADQLSLSPALGSVGAEGSLQISPGTSTTYTLTATNAGGSAEASARVTVSVAAAASTPSAPGLDALFAQHMKDVFFNYDQADIRPDERTSLTEDAEFLRSYPALRIVIEGHCDERGSEEYNLALGDRRATAARNYLVSLGVPTDQIRTSSVGKERPFCTDAAESCYQQNRRGHMERMP